MLVKKTTLHIKNFHLKLIFFIHFFFTSMSAMGAHGGSFTILFYNTWLLAFIFWGVLKDQLCEPLELAVLTNIACLIFDIAFLTSTDFYGMAFVLTILHLVARPCTSFFMLHILGQRAGTIVVAEAEDPVKKQVPQIREI